MDLLREIFINISLGRNADSFNRELPARYMPEMFHTCENETAEEAAALAEYEWSNGYRPPDIRA